MCSIRNGHFLAGRDEDRLADFNDALRDPGVRAIFTPRGGKGLPNWACARFRRRPSRPEAADWLQRHHRSEPGSSATMRLAGFNGPHVGWDRAYYGEDASDRLRRALMKHEPITIGQNPRELTAKVVVEGAATGDSDGRKSEHARTKRRMGMPRLRGGDPINRSSRHLYRSNRWDADIASEIGMSRWTEGSGGWASLFAWPSPGWEMVRH
jgi:muramoyltetrapeptide carboxypeptidase